MHPPIVLISLTQLRRSCSCGYYCPVTGVNEKYQWRHQLYYCKPRRDTCIHAHSISSPVSKFQSLVSQAFGLASSPLIIFSVQYHILRYYGYRGEVCVCVCISVCVCICVLMFVCLCVCVTEKDRIRSFFKVMIIRESNNVEGYEGR